LDWLSGSVFGRGDNIGRQKFQLKWSAIESIEARLPTERGARIASSLCKEGDSMNSFKDKIRGALNQGFGRLKQGFSRDTGDRRMRAEGSSQEMKGKGQKIVGHAKDIVGEVTEGARDTFRKTGT
jgi:uncharacterized protein YjbJ (UPF0337 family)